MTKPILLIQNTAGEGPGTILHWLSERSLPYMLVHTYRDQVLPDPGSIEAAIGLGCPHSVVRFHEHEYLKTFHAWLARAVREDVPYLGICFGGQLLASVLGARVEAGNAPEMGMYQAKLSDEGAADPLFAGFSREFPVFHWHNDTFRTPFNAVHLVGDGVWQHQAFRKNRQVGMQFHLEPERVDVARLCELHASEPAAVGKTSEGVMAEYEAAATTLRDLNFRLLDNWLG